MLSALFAGKSGARDDAERAELLDIIEARRFEPQFQPIVELATGTTVGYEALTRFADGRPPAHRFAAAARLGIGHHVELAAAQAAVDAGRRLTQDGWLAVNVSPSLITSGRLSGTFVSADRPVILEVTEQERIDDYRAVQAAVSTVAGVVGLSVDDAGSGFASLQHVLALRPQFVKLDRNWIRDLAADPARRALVAGLVHFALEIECTLIAEGVESPAERAELTHLGVPLAQGFLFARPAPARR
jgi:EAL domain-containing protein (putative c-di-GMP-specific phosphodiesterase class I)